VPDEDWDLNNFAENNSWITSACYRSVIASSRVEVVLLWQLLWNVIAGTLLVRERVGFFASWKPASILF
jgi:hypothetical protein